MFKLISTILFLVCGLSAQYVPTLHNKGTKLTIAHVADVANNCTGSATVNLSCTLSPAPGSGHLLVAGISTINSSTTVSSITGGGCSSWTQVTGARATNSTARPTSDVWFCATADGTTSVAVTFSGGNISNRVDISEFSGQAASPSDSAVTTSTSTLSCSGTTCTCTTSGTPSVGGELFFGFLIANNGGITAAGSGWTLVTNTDQDGWMWRINSGGSTSAQTVSGTDSSSGDTSACSTTGFKPGP